MSNIDQRPSRSVQLAIAAAVGFGAFMTAPDPEITKLAILGKVAEIAGQQSGEGLMGQAGAAQLMGICTMFGSMVRNSPPTRDPTDKLCRLILSMQENTRTINLGFASFSLLNIVDAPRIVCLGAVYNVKCVAFGGSANFFGERRSDSQPVDSFTRLTELQQAVDVWSAA